MTPQQKRAAKMLMAKLRREDPQFYAYAKRRGATRGLGQVDVEVQQESWFDKISNAATSFYQLRQQKEVMDMQLERAKQGLPPLDTKFIAAPPVKVEVTAPEFAPTFADAKKIILPVLGAGLAWLIFKRK